MRARDAFLKRKRLAAEGGTIVRRPGLYFDFAASVQESGAR